MWKLMSEFLIFVLLQVPLSPTQNDIEWRKDSHKLWFTFQSGSLGVYLFSTHFLFHMVFTWTTSVFKDHLDTVRNVFLTKVDCSSLQALLFLWTLDLYCFSQLFLFLCKSPFNRSIIPNCIALKSSRIIWWVQHSSPRHLNSLLWSMKIFRSLTQGKCIITLSNAAKTVLPCSSTHSKKLRGRNRKPIFPSIS